MERTFVFSVEIPYNRISIGKVNLLSRKGYSTVYDGNKKVIRLKFLFKEVRFNV